jgi:carbonic anhydrase/acetyltransferase-like protein (isoleucine patch superfamily)
MIYALDDLTPEIDDSAFVALNAQVMGQVKIGAECGIWFGAALRGDNELISVGARSNIQENAVLHTDMGFPLSIGEDCTIGHSAIVHGCTIGNACLVGMGAIIMNGVELGDNVLVAAGALIPEGKVIAPRSLVIGAPGKVARVLDEAAVAALYDSASHYVKTAKRFKTGLKPV